MLVVVVVEKVKERQVHVPCLGTMTHTVRRNAFSEAVERMLATTATITATILLFVLFAGVKEGERGIPNGH